MDRFVQSKAKKEASPGVDETVPSECDKGKIHDQVETSFLQELETLGDHEFAYRREKK